MPTEPDWKFEVEKALKEAYDSGVQAGYNIALHEFRSLVHEVKMPQGMPDFNPELPVTDLGLSQRPINCLRRVEIDTLGLLLAQTDNDLLSVINFGEKALEEVKNVLAQRGLSLSQTPTEHSYSQRLRERS